MDLVNKNKRSCLEHTMGPSERWKIDGFLALHVDYCSFMHVWNFVDLRSIRSSSRASVAQLTRKSQKEIGGNSMWHAIGDEEEASSSHKLWAMCWFSFDSFGKMKMILRSEFGVKTKVVMWTICAIGNWSRAYHFSSSMNDCIERQNEFMLSKLDEKGKREENFQFELSYRSKIHLKFVHLQINTKNALAPHRTSHGELFAFFQFSLQT